MTTSAARREEQNSSCALFLAIMFVLMLFGNTHGPRRHDVDDPEDAVSSSGGNGATPSSGFPSWFHHRYTTVPPSDSTNLTDDNFTDHTFVYPSGPRHPPYSQKNSHSATVVVLLFASLMIIQLLGFCFVVAMRRRAQRRLLEQDILPTTVHRSVSGWSVDYESDSEEMDIDSHPAMVSISSAASEGLPSYEDALRSDPNLPGYSINDPIPKNDTLESESLSSDERDGSCGRVESNFINNNGGNIPPAAENHHSSDTWNNNNNNATTTTTTNNNNNDNMARSGQHPSVGNISVVSGSKTINNNDTSRDNRDGNNNKHEDGGGDDDDDDDDDDDSDMDADSAPLLSR